MTADFVVNTTTDEDYVTTRLDYVSCRNVPPTGTLHNR